MPKHGMERHVITQDQEIKKNMLSAGEVLCWCSFGTSMGPSSSTTMMVGRWSILHGIMPCLKELKPIVHSKFRGMLTDGVVLHHDNIPPQYGSNDY
jgi:hypothetical protein